MAIAAYHAYPREMVPDHLRGLSMYHPVQRKPDLPTSVQAENTEKKMTEKQKLMVIDTDGGSDDVLAMMLALSQPDWKILAITAVFGNVSADVAYLNVWRILNFYKKTDIPVYKGSKSALLYPLQTDHNYHGSDGLSGNSALFPLPDKVEKIEKPAANVLVELAKEYPGQITLVALGPLTNLVRAQILDPSFSLNLKDLKIMGGNTTGKGNATQCAEFNFHCDPESADIVLREFQNIAITPWETCLTHIMSWDWYDMWTSSGTRKSSLVSKVTALAAMKNRNISKRAGYHCCGLLAMTAALFPHLITKKELRHTQVELQGKLTRAQMVVEWRDDENVTPNADIILEMDLKGVQFVWEKLLL